MCTPIQNGHGQIQLAKYCSLAAHGLLLLWLLHPASPKLVAPSFVVHGDHGVQIAHLYWPAQQRAGSEVSPGTSAADSRQQLNSHLTWKRRTSKAKAAERELPRPRIGLDDQTSAPGQAVQARAAGSALGPVLEGPLTGDEV